MRKRTLVASLLGVGLWACAAAQAQLRVESMPPDLLLPATWNGGSPRLEPVWPANAPVRSYPEFSGARFWLANALYIEPARLVDGRWERPRYHLGLPSDSLRSFMRSAGLEAQSCMLPMVRARANLSGGDTNGALWVYMRCTLD